MKNSHKVCDLIFEDSPSVLLMLGCFAKKKLRLLFSIIPLTDFSYVKSLSLNPEIRGWSIKGTWFHPVLKVLPSLSMFPMDLLQEPLMGLRDIVLKSRLKLTPLINHPVISVLIKEGH